MQLKRIYDPAEPTDGKRVLVDRLWPRGVSKERAALDLWAKDLAPSDLLRRAYHAGDLEFDAFASLYGAELADLDLSPVSDAGTLLTAAKVPERSHLMVLLQTLQQ